MAKFDLQRFDIKFGIKSLQIVHFGISSFEGFYGLGKAVSIAHNDITQIASSATINNAARTFHVDITSFKGVYKLQRVIKTRHDDVDLLLGDYKLNKNYKVKQNDENRIQSKYQLHKTVYYKAERSGKISSECYLNKNGYSIHNDATMFLGHYSIEKIKEDFFTIDAKIPPNGELRIDGENFTVLLNQENILHLFEGEFPLLTKDVIMIEVEAFNGVRLVGEIFYKERYL